jgi:hypothetical protein
MKRRRHRQTTLLSASRKACVWNAGVAVYGHCTWFWCVNLEDLLLSGEQYQNACERNRIGASDQYSSGSELRVGTRVGVLWAGDEFAVNFLHGYGNIFVKNHPTAWISELYYCHY